MKRAKKTDMNIIDIFVAIGVFVLSIFLIFIGNNFFDYDLGVSQDVNVTKAKVISIVDIRTTELVEGMYRTEIDFYAELTSGENSGETVKITQSIDDMFFPIPDPVEAGDSIIASNAYTTNDETDDVTWSYLGQDRTGLLLVVIISFIVLIVLIGSIKGLLSVLSLITTVGVIFFVYVPAILTGANIYLLTILILFFIILSSFIILNGINTKTLCAILGNIGGIIVTAILAVIVNYIFDISGAMDSDYMLLTMLEGGVSIDLQAIIWGGILIGSVGAIMDVSMSIASSMTELSVHMQDKSFSKMLKSGLNIGRDAIGTMTNTLILAYIGGSLATVLLLTANNRDFLVFMNFEIILVEILQAVIGSIGILLAVPTTALFSAWLYNREK